MKDSTEKSKWPVPYCSRGLQLPNCTGNEGIWIHREAKAEAKLSVYEKDFDKLVHDTFVIRNNGSTSTIET